MSADDWITCPVCHGLPDHLKEGYRQYYGKVSEEEYEDLKAEFRLKSESNPVRVDYDYSINADLTITFNFFAECEKCHAKWKHTGVVACQKSPK